MLNTLLRSSTRRQSFDGKATRQSRYSVTTAIATRSINEDWTMPDLLQLSRFLDEAKDLLPAAVALRRRIHSKPELGLDLPLTTEAVLDGLKGLDVEIARGKSTSGLVVSLTGTKAGSQSGRTILLRADMDALPMPEETGLDFALPARLPAACTRAAMIPTPPCSFRPCICFTAIATSCPAPLNSCSSPVKRDTPARGT